MILRRVGTAAAVAALLGPATALGMVIEIPWTLDATYNVAEKEHTHTLTKKIKWDEHLWGAIPSGYIEAGIGLTSRHDPTYTVHMPLTIRIEAPDTVRPGQEVQMKTSVLLGGSPSFSTLSRIDYDTSVILNTRSVAGVPDQNSLTFPNSLPIPQGPTLVFGDDGLTGTAATSSFAAIQSATLPGNPFGYPTSGAYLFDGFDATTSAVTSAWGVQYDLLSAAAVVAASSGVGIPAAAGFVAASAVMSLNAKVGIDIAEHNRLITDFVVASYSDSLGGVGDVQANRSGKLDKVTIPAGLATGDTFTLAFDRLDLGLKTVTDIDYLLNLFQLVLDVPDWIPGVGDEYTLYSAPAMTSWDIVSFESDAFFEELLGDFDDLVFNIDAQAGLPDFTPRTPPDRIFLPYPGTQLGSAPSVLPDLAVPEPGTLPLLVAALLGLVWSRRSWQGARSSALLCAGLASAGAQALPLTSDTVVVVDESGSMAGKQAWLGAMIRDAMDPALYAAGVTGERRYGLVGFGEPLSGHLNSQDVWNSPPYHPSAHGHDVPSQYFADAQGFHHAVANLVADSSVGDEDGYAGMMFALTHYPWASGALHHLILVTDEDRDPQQASLTQQSVQAKLAQRDAFLSVVLAIDIACADGSAAMGVDAGGRGYLPNLGSTGPAYFTCEGASIADSAIKTDYATLALATGGMAWDLDFLMGGFAFARGFTSAYADLRLPDPDNDQGAGGSGGSGGGQGNGVPEPATLMLLGVGTVAMTRLRRRTRNA